ncbi:unnamed protein product, partial [Musa textilis]
QEEITKEFEEKKADLQPKVVEIYEASAVEIKVQVFVLFVVVCLHGNKALELILLNIIAFYHHRLW